ncbi:hypothetical protein [Numidum massiliense]|uniref:hypothetical protein n=1 Tax=Numidum massiliense TaxID=1522315 RepID=UPI0006D560EF|nr:hypothetical protein [Numidum massiliense]
MSDKIDLILVELQKLNARVSTVESHLTGMKPLIDDIKPLKDDVAAMKPLIDDIKPLKDDVAAMKPLVEQIPAIGQAVFETADRLDELRVEIKYAIENTNENRLQIYRVKQQMKIVMEELSSES